MKVIVQIPCYNEEKTIRSVIQSIPKKIPGVKKVEILVIDDGSTDNTLREIKRAKPKYIIANKKNIGLAKTFSKALSKSLEYGADIIVNTDADNQYDQKEIAKLVEPIIKDEADMVIGDRQVWKLKHMPRSKKIGNILGSFTIRLLTSDCKVNDASSGFRAFSKEAAQSFDLFSAHTYTHETIIQAVNNGLIIKEVPVKFRKRKHGGSRLIVSIPRHIKRSVSTILRTILIYKSFKYLLITGSTIAILGSILGLRYLSLFLAGEGGGHTQSLILSSILISVGVNIMSLGVIADLIGLNRKLIKKINA